MKLHRAAALLLVTLLVGACSDFTGSGDPTESEDTTPPGTFLGHLSGDVSGAFRGTAVLVGGARPTEPVGIHLTDDRVPHRIRVLVLAASSRPAPGTYSVGPLASAPFRGQFHVYETTPRVDTLSLAATEGTVTIEAAGAEEVRGSYDLTTRDDPASGPRTTVRATGRFAATPRAID